jgi:hypothetical protein
MRNALWIALAAAALTAHARADQPLTFAENSSPATTPDSTAPLPGAEPNTPPSMPNYSGCCTGRCPNCGGPMASGCQTCEDCGKRQHKVARFLDWLIYVPLDRGKTKCCGCWSEPPPAWAFFPCEGGGRCATCVAASATIYYAKQAGATSSTQVPNGTAAPATKQLVEAAYPSTGTAPKTAPPPVQAPTVAPKTVAPVMPVLDPTQFRRAPANNN